MAYSGSGGLDSPELKKLLAAYLEANKQYALPDEELWKLCDQLPPVIGSLTDDLITMRRKRMEPDPEPAEELSSTEVLIRMRRRNVERYG